ncbi:MAG: flippase-like domain-containing protein [Candidatus Dormibacteraeota bacterium]|nr:flippase-like domain-containing protein [Candidatus Dormibacteraeota bacterium]MBV9525383.1 flippase-like domain-containing protein [Candidatus Dormibacteraeota bacterium]
MTLLKTPLHLLRRFWAELFALAGLIALIVGVNPLNLGHVFQHIQWNLALLMVPLVLAIYLCRGWAWWVGLRAVGEHISFRHTQIIEIAGQVMIVLPMGDLARVAMVRSTDHERGAGAITATVALQEIAYMMLMSFGALPQLVQRHNIALLMLAVMLGFLSIFAVLLWEPAYERAIRVVEHVRPLRRFDKQLHEIRGAFVRLCRPRTLLTVFVLQGLAAALSFLLFYFALLAIGLKVSYITAVFVLGVSYTFAAISFLPLGIGAFEGLLTVIMLTFGIPAASGAAAGLLYRGYNDVLMAMIGAPALLYVRRQQRAGTWIGTRRHAASHHGAAAAGAAD